MLDPAQCRVYGEWAETMKRSPKTRARNRIIKQLDDLARQACFERDGHVCVRCGKGNVQWCHILSRRHKCTRWELDNVLSMDAGCHRFWHSYPTLSGESFRRNWPDRHERITALYNKGGKVDLAAKLAELKELALPPATPRVPGRIKDSSIPF